MLSSNIQTDHFESFQREEEVFIDVLPPHECSTKHAISIKVIDDYGKFYYT